jgi:hypothetical protein
MSVAQSCPILQVLLLSQDLPTEGTRLATIAVAKAAAVEVTGAALAITAEPTATAIMAVQAAVGMVLSGAMQATQTRTPSLA